MKRIMAFIWGLKTLHFYLITLSPHTQSPCTVFAHLSPYITNWTITFACQRTATALYIHPHSSTTLSPSFHCADIIVLLHCPSPLSSLRTGNSIDAAALNILLDECESWMWDSPDAPITELNEKVRFIVVIRCLPESSYRSRVAFLILNRVEQTYLDTYMQEDG